LAYLRYTGNTLLFIVLIFLTGCSNMEPKTKAVSKTEDTPVVNSVQPEKKAPGDPFTLSHIKAFGDSIVSYFNKRAGYDIRKYETAVDTFKQDNYEWINIKIRTEEYKTHGIISYAIYTFPTKEEASHFFNDLKTQELILGFGLNKRPNHILVDSNKVYWHQLEHPYGHRIKDLTHIFNKSFNFRTRATNVDSVSGFTYCHCTNDDSDIKGLLGNWRSEKLCTMMVYHYYPEPNGATDCPAFFTDNDKLKFSGKNVQINSTSYSIAVQSSIKLPENELYWKYDFPPKEPNENTDYTTPFLKQLHVLQKMSGSVTVYDIQLSNHCYVRIVKPEKGIAYMMMDNGFYELKR
jgi:hypothetical protein